MPETTRDTIHGLGLTLTQPGAGHRVGADAVLLAAAAGAPVERLIDVGAGVGSVGLALIKRWPAAQGDLIEIAPELAEFARANAAEAGLAERAHVRELDLFDKQARKEIAPADLVVTNPPFYAPGRVRISPDSARARAHVLDDSIGPWIVAALALLKSGGRFVMIHRPEDLTAILAAIGQRLGALAVRPIHPKAGEPAIRILVSGVKGSRGPLSLAPGLILHEADGAFTPFVGALYRGEAVL